MAKEQESKITLERTYTIPLRRKFKVAPTHKRANRAVKAVKEFLQRHMKSDDVKIGHHLNLKIWENGIKNPPHKVKINAIKDDKGVVRAEIVGKEIQLEQEKKEEQQEGGMAEKLGLKKEEQQPEQNTYKPAADTEGSAEQGEQDKTEEQTTTEESGSEAEEKPAEESSTAEEQPSTESKESEESAEETKEESATEETKESEEDKTSQ